jgi:thiamine kinase-like enzyme
VVFFSSWTNCYKKHSIKTEKIVSLWAGLGSIYRAFVNNQTYIIKYVQIPLENTVSNKRRIASYYNESYFYSKYSENVDIARYYAHEKNERNTILIIQDLSINYRELSSLNQIQFIKAIQYLAKFHAYFYNCKDINVSENGSYWYLNTRKSEWKNIPKKHPKLKDCAELIDSKTKDVDHETLIHGDSKSENFMWSRDDVPICVDFQYVGKGLGAKDLVYLICSSTDEFKEEYLSIYFDFFLKYAVEFDKTHDYTFDLFSSHFDWCTLDYLRFMAGWGFWGNYKWCFDRTKNML